ncbi:MAG: hypothetical protein QOE77_1772 [Blastocatellia bacterium]|jgi:outer membrane protein assembly factor BamB|nr:hypothetical protein [Blastocatellia bacterium]
MNPLATPKPLKLAMLVLVTHAVLLSYLLLGAVRAQTINGQEHGQTGNSTTALDSKVAIERANPQRTGVYPSGATPPTGEILWESWKLFVMKRGRIEWGRTTTMSDRTGSITFSGPDFFWPYEGVGYSDPIVADGILYFSLYIGDGYLYALDARTGEVRWRAKREKGVYSPPTVADKTLYVGADSGIFYAFDLEKNQEKWRQTRMDQSMVEGSPTVAEGVVYYAANNGNLYALSTKTGELKWTFDAKSQYLSAPAVSDGMIYFTNREYLFGLETKSGKEKWKLQLKEGGRAPAVANGLVYFRDYEGHIRTVDAKTGQPVPKPHKDHQTGARIVINGQMIYFTGWNTGSLFAVDAMTRETAWTFSDTSELHCTAPIADAQRIYFTCDDGRLYAVDAKTGKKAWATARKKAPISTPVVADSMLYFISDDGKVYGVK